MHKIGRHKRDPAALFRPLFCQDFVSRLLGINSRLPNGNVRRWVYRPPSPPSYLTLRELLHLFLLLFSYDSVCSISHNPIFKKDEGYVWQLELGGFHRLRIEEGWKAFSSKDGKKKKKDENHKGKHEITVFFFYLRKISSMDKNRIPFFLFFLFWLAKCTRSNPLFTWAQQYTSKWDFGGLGLQKPQFTIRMDLTGP